LLILQPERIQAVRGYAIQSDSWSLGITLMELAMGKFPFPPDGKPLAQLELLEYIVHEVLPLPPKDEFSVEFIDFIEKW